MFHVDLQITFSCSRSSNVCQSEPSASLARLLRRRVYLYQPGCVAAVMFIMMMDMTMIMVKMMMMLRMIMLVDGMETMTIRMMVLNW